jgi:hypothetical protein
MDTVARNEAAEAVVRELFLSPEGRANLYRLYHQHKSNHSPLVAAPISA